MKTKLMALGMMAAAYAFGGVYDDFDYHRFQLVPPADGTYIIVK